MMVYLASYTELTRLSSTNLLIPPRLSSGRINGTAKRRRTGIYFAVISPLSLSLSLLCSREDGPASTLRCFAAASLQRKRESWNWKPANRLRNRPALFNFCPIARGCWPVASLSPPFLFVSCIFIYHPFLQLLSFYLSTPIILHSLFSLFLSFLSFFLSPLLPLAPTSFTFYRHSHPPSSSSSFFPSFLFFLPFFFRSRSLSISVSLFRSSDGNDILAMEEMGW